MFAHDMNPSQRHEIVSERRETGLSLEVIGGIILFFNLLVLFFFPAGLKIGYKYAFFAVMAALSALGLVLIFTGLFVRRKA